MYLQFNNTTTVYLQCSRLPMLRQAPNKWRYRTRLPMLLDYNNAACSLCCSRLPTSGDTARGSLCCLLTTMQHAPYAALLVQRCRLPTCGDTALQVASYEAPNSNAAAYTAGCQPWQYRTASGSLQCCARLPLCCGCQHVAPSMLLAYNHAACSLYCACQPWQYRTANRTASDFQRQCCCLTSGSLYAARGFLYAAPAKYCLP
jgi:hypothetical protein